MTTWKELHQLLNRVPESDAPTMRTMLGSFLNPMELSRLLTPLGEGSDTEEKRRTAEFNRANLSSAYRKAVRWWSW